MYIAQRYNCRNSAHNITLCRMHTDITVVTVHTIYMYVQYTNIYL